MEQTGDIRAIKQLFYAYRNGIIADALRKAGDKHEFIMGCQLTDIILIAKQYEQSVALASTLWNDVKSRESRIIAPMLYPVEDFDKATAIKWCDSVENQEIADVLCHRLLRKRLYAKQLALIYASREESMKQYLGFRLLLNLLQVGVIKPAEIDVQMMDAAAKKASSGTKKVIQAIQEEYC